MHSHVIYDDRGVQWSVNVNGDFSGDAHFTEWDKEGTSQRTFSVPFEVIAQLVNRAIYDFKMSQLEQSGNLEFVQYREAPNDTRG